MPIPVTEQQSLACVSGFSNIAATRRLILWHKTTHSLHTFLCRTLKIQFKNQHEVPKQYQFFFFCLWKAYQLLITLFLLNKDRRHSHQLSNWCYQFPLCISYTLLSIELWFQMTYRLRHCNTQKISNITKPELFFLSKDYFLPISYRCSFLKWITSSTANFAMIICQCLKRRELIKS